MRLKQVDETHTPERFFLPRIAGQNAETGENIVVHDVEVEDTADAHVGALGSLKKRVHNGVAEFVLYPDRYEMLWNDEMVVRADIVGRVFNNGSWVNQSFDFADADRTKIGDRTFRFIRSQAAFGVGTGFAIQFSFGKGVHSQEFYLDVPGKPVQIRWRVEVMLNKLQANRDDGRGLAIGADDPDAVLTEPEHADPENWGYFVYTYGGVDGKLCDAEDGRTIIERFQAEAGLRV